MARRGYQTSISKEVLDRYEVMGIKQETAAFLINRDLAVKRVGKSRANVFLEKVGYTVSGVDANGVEITKTCKSRIANYVTENQIDKCEKNGQIVVKTSN